MAHSFVSPIGRRHDGTGPGRKPNRWDAMTLTLQYYAEHRGYRLVAAYGRVRSNIHEYWVRPGVADAAALAAAVRQDPYAWYQDGRPARDFAH